MGAYELPYCVADVNADGTVDIDDLFDVLTHWGDCPDPPDDCPWDIDDSGEVDIDDLFAVLADWGYGNPDSSAVPESVADCISQYAGDPEDLATCIEAIILTGGG